MNSREKAWHENKKPRETIHDRMKSMTFVDPWSKKGIQRSEEFAKKYGRAWWVFVGVPVNQKKYLNSWIMQFNIKENDENA
jgi:hypothetical protein|tara:strand:- start:33 stop:275 length:243 start_codon:yes stop_codon:yes gene_type:complete